MSPPSAPAPEPPPISEAAPSSRLSDPRVEGSIAACAALGLGIALALVVDLSSPRVDGARLTTTAVQTRDGDDLASKMEAQIAAGAPGVALAIESAARPDRLGTSRVAAAHAHAQFELGDLPGALKTTRLALRICDVLGSCDVGARLALERIDAIADALLSAGITDPRTDSKKAAEVIQRVYRDVSLGPPKP